MVKFFRKYHKWIGIVSILFILNFAVSGIILNHRNFFSGINISRTFLPESYHFKKWNNGAIKGTIKLSDNQILIYGAAGVWLTDSLCKSVSSYEEGMPKGIDNRSLRSVVKTREGKVFAASTHLLYQLDTVSGIWKDITSRIALESRLTDLCVTDEGLFVISRSNIFKANAPYTHFEKLGLKQATDYSPKVSLFKTMWILHSGEIFGLPGKLVVDALGFIIIIITLTGLMLTLLRASIRRRVKKNKQTEHLKRGWKFSLKWHNKLGYGLFFLLLFVVITGTFLRPPLLIPIVRAKVKAIPYSTLDSENPWHEKLRVLRYDAIAKHWMLYSSDGFYHFSNFNESPKPIHKKPPISVMGVTVLEQKSKEEWLVGSFSGLYVWNSYSGKSVDAFTKEEYKQKVTFGPPVMTNPINGYSKDFAVGELAFNYEKGVVGIEYARAKLEMPLEVSAAPMSLWHFALELHVGRMYRFFLGPLSALFVFFSGLIFLFVLVSGYIVYKRKHKKRKKRPRAKK